MSGPAEEAARPDAASGNARSSIDVGGLTGGAAALILGGVAIREGLRYPIGSVARMGPGYFPIVLGVILGALGLLLLALSLRARPEPRGEAFLWRPLFMIPLAIAFFGFAVARLGLAPATFGLVFLSSLSERDPAFRAILLLATAMTALVWIAFSLILGLPYPLFANELTR